MEWVIKIIKGVALRRFWGKLIISFENGKIVGIKKAENLKPEA